MSTTLQCMALLRSCRSGTRASEPPVATVTGELQDTVCHDADRGFMRAFTPRGSMPTSRELFFSRGPS